MPVSRLTFHGSKGLAVAVCAAGLACGGSAGMTGNAGTADPARTGGTAGTAGPARTGGTAGTGGVTGTGGVVGATGDGLPDAGVDRGGADVDHQNRADASGAGSGPGLTGLTVEALQVAGTHNSFHEAPPIAFHPSHSYTHRPLDQQLAGGVRALELDLHRGSDGTFEIYHIALIDPNASCRTLEACLGVVSTWSTAHPRHAPVFLWLEIKDDTGGTPIDDLLPIEAIILKVFTPERIMTPAWLRGSYPSPRARLMAAGWPSLEDARGKVLFALIDRDARTRKYAHDGTSLDDRLMWVNAAPAEFALPWAAITKVESLGLQNVIAQAHAAHLLIAANTCTIDLTDEACSGRLREFADAGVHMMHDDLPFPIPGRRYVLRLPGGASPACNPVTAPGACAPLLE